VIELLYFFKEMAMNLIANFHLLKPLLMAHIQYNVP